MVLFYPKRTPELEEMFEATKAGDVDRIRESFRTGSFHPQQVQFCLEDAVESNRPVEVARCFVELGAKISELRVKDFQRCRSLALFQFAAETGFDFRGKGHVILEDFVGNRGILDFLLDQGADINRPDPHRTTDGRRMPGYAVAPGAPRKYTLDLTLNVLNNAAALGDIELFDYLVSRGADVTKSIALHNAARCKDPVKTKAMIAHLVGKYGFDVNAEDTATGLRDGDKSLWPKDCGPPIHFAWLFRNIAAAEALQEAGADVEEYLPFSNFKKSLGDDGW